MRGVGFYRHCKCRYMSNDGRIGEDFHDHPVAELIRYHDSEVELVQMAVKTCAACNDAK